MTQKGVAAMKIRPALDEVKTIAAAGGYKVLPVSGEILSDICTLVGELDPATLPPELKITVRTADGEVMAVQHTKYPIYGVQFHPESILTPQGRLILKNFMEG